MQGKTKKLRILLLVFVAGLLTWGARAQTAVTVSIDKNAKGFPVPADFAGLSFESSNLLADKDGKHMFSPENKDLVDLFRTIGIRNLRVGGGTADDPNYRIPGPQDIDELFGFAKAADVSVIYTLRLLNGNANVDAEIAHYIEQHYASQLVCFQIGNEPDWHSYHSRDPRIFETMSGSPGTAYASFLSDWRSFAATIDKLVPNARYTGPDTGSNYPLPGTKDTDAGSESWTQRFAEDEKSLGKLVFVAQHDYVGEGAKGVSVSEAIDSMLSREWVDQRYPLLFNHVLAPVEKLRLPYRMTEANDYTGGVDGASNAFASALWALDYLHWHAAHHSAGIDFHNKRWIFTDTVFEDSSNTFQFNPKAYAIRAFDLASDGNAVPTTIENEGQINLTAYAVRHGDVLYLTLINKEHGPQAKEATVTIADGGITRDAVGMYLKAPNGDPGSRTGITLGGAPLTTGSWNGVWSRLAASGAGKVTVSLPATSALIVRLQLK